MVTVPGIPLEQADSPFNADTPALLITHMHPAHFDQGAAELLPKDLPVVARTDGKHCVGLIGQAMGRVAEFIVCLSHS